MADHGEISFHNLTSGDSLGSVEDSRPQTPSITGASSPVRSKSSIVPFNNRTALEDDFIQYIVLGSDGVFDTINGAELAADIHDMYVVNSSELQISSLAGKKRNDYITLGRDLDQNGMLHELAKEICGHAVHSKYWRRASKYYCILPFMCRVFFCGAASIL